MHAKVFLPNLQVLHCTSRSRDILPLIQPFIEGSLWYISIDNDDVHPSKHLAGILPVDLAPLFSALSHRSPQLTTPNLSLPYFWQ